jgi:hypothetical protein
MRCPEELKTGTIVNGGSLTNNNRTCHSAKFPSSKPQAEKALVVSDEGFLISPPTPQAYRPLKISLTSKRDSDIFVTVSDIYITIWEGRGCHPRETDKGDPT